MIAQKTLTEHSHFYHQFMRRGRLRSEWTLSVLRDASIKLCDIKAQRGIVQERGEWLWPLPNSRVIGSAAD